MIIYISSFFFVLLHKEMILSKYSNIIFTLAILASLGSCKNNQEKESDCCRAIYYWRTTWKPTEFEKNFLQKHKITKLYLRYFDVILTDNQPVPIATLDMNDSMPKGMEIVPVVFIKDECLSKDTSLARLVGQRVLQMSETENLKFNELQIDCDWRESTRVQYFEFIERLKKHMRSQGDYKVSSTIRLHQLRQTPPPADCGILMCYNTGDLTNPKTRNSVLDPKDVELYAKDLDKYELELGAAYPVFSWKLLFSQGKFRSILRDVDLQDTTLFAKQDSAHYMVLKSHSVPSLNREEFGLRLFKDDMIKWDQSTKWSVSKTKKLIEGQNNSLSKTIVLYSLNEKELNRYTHEEIESFYSAD